MLIKFEICAFIISSNNRILIMTYLALILLFVLNKLLDDSFNNSQLKTNEDKNA